MGIGFSRDLEEIRHHRDRSDRNEDMGKYREHQHKLDVKREHSATQNVKDLLTSQELQPLVSIFMAYLKEQAEHVKASHKRRETRFKEERRPPHPDGRPAPGMPPQHLSRRGHNRGMRPYHSPPRGAGGRYPPPGPPAGNFDPNDDEDDDGGGAGEYEPLPSYRTQQGAMHRPRPPSDHMYDHQRHPRPRNPDLDPRYPMHGGLDPGHEPFPLQQRRHPRAPKRTRGGHHAHGQEFGGRARGARHERDGGGGGGSGSGFEEDGAGLGSGLGMEGEGGSQAGSDNTYAGRRGMRRRRGVRRRGGSQ